jgi:hypothetical protein
MDSHYDIIDRNVYDPRPRRVLKVRPEEVEDQLQELCDREELDEEYALFLEEVLGWPLVAVAQDPEDLIF